MSMFAVPGIVSGRAVAVAAWSPLDLSPEGWWRADLGHAASDTDPVGLWENQGTAGTDADLLSSGSNRPVHLESGPTGFNGRPVMDFTASSNHVFGTAASSWWHLASESASFTIWAVVRTTVTAATFQRVVATRNVGTLGGINVEIRVTGGIRSQVFVSGAGQSLQDTGPSGVTASTVHVISTMLRGAVTTAEDELYVRLDGGSVGGDTTDLTSPIAASSNREFLVGGTTTTSGTFTGQIAEVGFVKRLLTSGEAGDLATYLSAWYDKSWSNVVVPA